MTCEPRSESGNELDIQRAWIGIRCCSTAQSCPTLCDPMDFSTLGFPICHQLPGLTQTHVHWVGDAISNHLILCHPLLLPSVFPSIRVFSNESVLCIRWPKYWNFSFSISPSSEYSGLISFGIHWFDLLVWSKGLSRVFSSTTARRHQCSAFFIVLLSHLYTTTGKNHCFDCTDLCIQYDKISKCKDIVKGLGSQGAQERPGAGAESENGTEWVWRAGQWLHHVKLCSLDKRVLILFWWEATGHT